MTAIEMLFKREDAVVLAALVLLALLAWLATLAGAGTGMARMGVAHGAYCLGCCAVLMLLLFVGGVMNLVWIAGLTLLVAVEKLAPFGAVVARVTGAVLIAGGAALLAAGP